MKRDEPAPPPHPDVTLAILAGGRGTRLGGVPKGLLVLEGRTLLDRLLALRPLFGASLLVVNEPGPYAAYSEVPKVPDEIPDRGPPGGVHAALARAQTPWVLVVAADMPFVRRPVVERLLAARSEGLDAVLFEANGRWEPLLACYRTSTEERWRAALGPSPSFRSLLASFRVCTLGTGALEAVDPGLASLVSINRPEDMERFGVRFRDADPPMR